MNTEPFREQAIEYVRSEVFGPNNERKIPESEAWKLFDQIAVTQRATVLAQMELIGRLAVAAQELLLYERTAGRWITLRALLREVSSLENNAKEQK